jgi:hypothetical protein
MFIRLHSGEIRELVDKWCKVDERMCLSDCKLHRFLGEVESILCTRLTLGMSVNLYTVLSEVFERLTKS